MNKRAGIEEREFPDATDENREVLIHKEYQSWKDIKICLDYYLANIADRREIESIHTLHEVLKSEYGKNKCRRD